MRQGTRSVALWGSGDGASGGGAGGVGSRTQVPLKNVAVDVEIVDFLAEVRMAQTFVNEGDQPLEVEYQFPLDPAAAVNGFEVTFSDGRTVRGKVQGKEEARDTYDDAVAAGGGGYLLEQNEREPDMFSCSLGNMAPGMEATVVIRMVSELSVTDTTAEGESPGALSLLVQTGVFPRYDPARADLQPQDQGAEAGGAESTQGRQVTTLDYSMACQVRMRMPCAIADVTARFHQVLERTVSDDGTKVVLQLNMTGSPNDLLLRIHKTEPHQSALWVHAPPSAAIDAIDAIGADADATADADETGPDKNKKVAMVSWYPHLDEDEFMNDQRAEVIFVVDRSGSMRSQGRIEAARRTLAICVSSLPEGTLFNVVGFGTRQELLFPRSMPLDDSNKSRALRLSQDMQPNLGGTDILTPLRDMQASAPLDSYPRQVFVITDGAVRNTGEIVKFVQQQHMSQGVRYFSFGVGAGASQGLVKGIATAGGGAFEMAPDASDVESTVMRQLRRALLPAVVQVSIDWGLTAADGGTEVEVDTIPSAMASKPVFQGDRMLAFAYVSQDASFTSDVVVRGSTPDGEVQECVWEAGASSIETRTAPARMLRACAAKALLDELEVKHAMAELAGQTAECRAIKKRAVRVSTETGVQCKFTSFVAVEERDGAVTGEMQRVELRQGAVFDGMQPVSTVRANTQLHAHRQQQMLELQRQTDELRCIASSIECLVSRQESLDCLEDLSQELGHQSKAFYKAAKKNDSSWLSGVVGGAASLVEGITSALWGEEPPVSTAAAAPPATAPPRPPAVVPASVAPPTSREADDTSISNNSTTTADMEPPLPASAPTDTLAPSFASAPATEPAPAEHMVMASPSCNQEIVDIVSRQSAAGSWTWADLTLVHLLESQVLEALDQAKAEGLVLANDDLFVTAVFVAVLESSRFASNRDLWIMAVRKARKFLQRNEPGQRSDGVDSWCAAAKAFVESV